HKIAIRLNSTVDLAVASMNKGEQIVLKARVPVSALNGSSNTISIYSYPTSSTSVNWVLFDWFEIEYPRRLTAVDDSLQFDFRTLTNRKLRAVQVGGLNTKDIVLYRVAPSPKRMAAVSFSAIAPYTLTFSDTIGPNESYILCGGRSVASPPIVKTKQFKNLRANSRQIDYLALTHRLFAAEAQQYCSYITTAKRLSTMLVDVDDVFDEFGFGYPTAESIRDFVRSSSQWPSPMPSYLFLMGDASYDYKFYYQQYSSINYVPSLGYPVSDVALAVVDTIVGLPQLYVGRLPVNNVGDITGYLSTITNYNNAPFDEWNKRYLFFSGGTPDTPGQIESFKATNEAIINSNVMPAPIGGLAAHFYKTTSPQSDFGPYTIQQVHEAINNGAVFISYIGHSGTQTWDNSIGDPTQLQNTQGRFTLVSDFGCSTAKFLSVSFLLSAVRQARSATSVIPLSASRPSRPASLRLSIRRYSTTL
ncbi:MAG: C25 family cysteine peptidase, partial [Ignavibacteriales bacterium]|nr:C25 family cysteine peptidase [Ignavibacteriales bacterium]